MKSLLSIKSFVLFAGIILASISCNEQTNKTSPNGDSTNQKSIAQMRPRLDSTPVKMDSTKIKNTIALNNGDLTAVNEKDPEVGGSVYYNFPYCGGAKPTQEQLDKLAKWQEMGSGYLILKSKSAKYEISVSPDGEFAKKIPPGNYDVYLEKGFKGVWDISANGCEDCLTKPIVSVKLVAGLNNLIRFTFRCPPNSNQRP